MKIITSFTTDPFQKLALILDDGSKVDFSLQYITNQLGWYYSFTYGSFAVNNRRLVTSPNMIRAFRGFLPFGLAVTTTDGLEPIYIDDFISGRASFYLLNSEDVADVEALIAAR